MKIYKVNYLISSNGKTIGANIRDLQSNKSFNIRKEEFLLYNGQFENAIVTSNGVIRAKKGNLHVIDTKELLNTQNKKHKKVTCYTLMYRDSAVLTLNICNNTVNIHNKNYIPFSLRGKKKITAESIKYWIEQRISNINRTYMNLVYIARDVGRDSAKVIKDSCGISFTDQYWISTSDINVTWQRLQELRDTNTELNDVALRGKLDLALDLKSGYTTLFATKGFFPKAIYDGWLYKRKEDSLLEYPAYLIGKHLGISTSEVKIIDKYIGIKLFTSNKFSLVHASELKEYYNSDDELYNIMYAIGRTDIAFQMQRMFIYNFIIGNPDLHEDNYGCIYDTDTFDIISLSPCYDHNVAFQEGFNGLSRGRLSGSSILTLDEYTKQFILGHQDIVSKLRGINILFEELNNYLTDRQMRELKCRINAVIQWGTA